MQCNNEKKGIIVEDFEMVLLKSKEYLEENVPWSWKTKNKYLDSIIYQSCQIKK